jgi:uncharacterized membrane protein
MTQGPPEVVVAAFPTEAVAKEALHDLDDAQRRGIIEVQQAGVVTRNQRNRLRVAENPDSGFGRGAMYGGLAGAALGLAGGRLGWLMLGGAAIGGVLTRVWDRGFSDRRLRRMGTTVPPSSSAVVAVVEHLSAPAAGRMLAERGADVSSGAVGSGIYSRRYETPGQEPSGA